MTEESHLSGKLRRLQLPVYTEPTGPDAPLLKRLLLPQGELAPFYDGEDGIHYIALIELKAGGVRGNHYHRRKREHVYVISGKAELLAENLADGAKVSVPLRAGELAIIEREIAHALRTVEPGCAVEFSPSRFDGTDIHRHAMVEGGSTKA